MSKNKILVLGANGQLGKELRQLTGGFTELDYIFLSREDLPIHHFPLLRDYFSTLSPACCINGAAYTAVDRAESEAEAAALVNTESVGVLAAVCREHQTKFIHVSTDYVFDGASSIPYREEDSPNPLNVYGKTKLEGEKLVMLNNPESVIIRSSWVYSRFGKNFVKTMMRLMKSQLSVRVVNDQLGSPTWAGDLAAAIMQIVTSAKWVPGIFHYTNDGFISWYDFAVEIGLLIKSPCQVIPIPTSEFPTAARRPLNGCLDKKKIQSVYGISLVPWKLSLEKCIHQILEKENG